MSQIKLDAQPRNEFGKGAARRARRANLVPAVVYGHGSDPIHITVPAHDTMMALRQTNALFALPLGKKDQLAIVQDVQRDPVRQIIEHVDFLAVKAGEKTEVEVPVIVVGEPFSGCIVIVQSQHIQLEAEVTNLPSSVEVNVDGLEDGHVINAGDITLPAGATLVTPEDHTVITIIEPREEAEEVEGEEGAEGAEGEAAASSDDE
ncbi:MAG: 50S ribosomal protein L25/general stress protein Ctc [Cellulomonadaceae bacterium]|jgi:large subunit ribosomal protein L25|nr:50S ribosomal protein L25/general stress protein Ctc [Cellulomonadaceae bacterium]